MSPGEGKVPPWVQPLGPTLFSKIFVIHLIPPPKRQPIPGVQTVQHRRQTDEVEKRRETRTTRRRRLCPCPVSPRFSHVFPLCSPCTIQLVLTIWKPGTGYQKWHYSIMATRSFSISAGPTPTSLTFPLENRGGRAPLLWGRGWTCPGWQA